MTVGAETPTPALVLAAGQGTRLRPLTERTPKCLAPIGGRPLLSYWHHLLARASVPLALINAHAHADQVRRYVHALNGRGEVRWEVAEEERLLGSAGTLARHLARLEEHQHYLVVYADNLSNMDLGAFLGAHRAGGAPVTLALFSAPVPERCGVVELGEGGVVASFQEKPARPTSNLAFAGVAAFSRGALVPGELPEVGDLAGDLLPQLVGRARGWLWPGYHRDVGTPQDLTGAEEDLRAGRFQTGPESRA